MTSIESVRNSIAEARGGVLVLMQEGTDEQGISDEWGYLMSVVYELLHEADKYLDDALLT